jgi:hypothetical protein
MGQPEKSGDEESADAERLDAERLDCATDEAIAACGGDHARDSPGFNRRHGVPGSRDGATGVARFSARREARSFQHLFWMKR